MWGEKVFRSRPQFDRPGHVFQVVPRLDLLVFLLPRVTSTPAGLRCHSVLETWDTLGLCQTLA